MVQIDGKYQLTKTENFLEFLKALGTTDTDAEQINKAHSLLTVAKVGNKVTLSDISGSTPLSKTFVIGETNEEQITKDLTAQTSVTFAGNKLSLDSGDAKQNMQRVYEFSDDGLVITYNSFRNVTGKRFFKRV